MDKDAVIETENLTKVYKDFWGRPRLKALDHLNIKVFKGEIFGILGPNGSGKTTTMKLLLGLIFPTGGNAWVLSKKPTDVAVKARIGFLPEESYLYRFLNADETLDFFGRLFKIPHKERKRRIDGLISQFGLTNARKRQLKEYYDTLEQKVNDRTKELKETKEYLENLLETANDVIYTLNNNGIVTYVNKKVEEWGYKKDELIGKSFLTILSSRHQGDRFKKTVTDGIRQTYEIEVIDKHGGIKYAALSVSPLRSNEGKIVEVLGIAKDITGQKLLEQQVIQAEKMSAIGQLAAGIAHEINNPLGGILNCLYNLRKKRLSQEREEEYIKSMEDGIHRVQRTVDQLLDFSLQHEPELTSVNVNSLIEEVLSLIGYAIIKNGIKLKKELDADLQQLMVDQHKMSQVLMNILLNAVQAMKGKGQIRVKTFQEDGWCCIEVADNGEGIPSHILPKIFDPFFTTKDVGKGTGLGLAVSRGIVEKHSGKIEVKSELGEGTTFTVKLPVK